MQPWEQFQRAAPQAAKQPWERFGGTPTQPESPDILSRIGGDLSNRWQEGQQAASDYNAGKITAPEMLLASTGKVVAGSANDIAGEVMNSLTPDIVKRGLASGAQGAADKISQTSIGQSAGDKLLAAKDAYENFMKSNPRAARNIESAGNIASFIPTERGIESAVEAAPAAYNTVKNTISPAVNGLETASQKLPGIFGDVSSGSQAPSPISAEMVRNAGQNAYKAVADSGTVFSPAVTDKALNVINNAKQKALFGGTVLTKEQADINAALEDYAGAKGQSMTMQDLQGLDSTLGDKAAQAYVSGNSNKGRIISGVQDKIRDMVQPGKLSASDVVAGSPEGADILTNHAIPLWSTQAKMQDIEKIINRANAMDNPSTSMKTGFRNLMLNQGKMAQFTPEVQKLITKAATTGKVDDLLGIVGSRLNAIAGMASGSPEAAIMGNVTSAAGRGIRTALKNNQANAILSSMVEDVRPSIEKFSNPQPYAPAAPVPSPPMLALPAPQTVVSVDSLGRATSPLSSAARESLGQGTPIITKMLELASPNYKGEFSAAWDKLTEAQQAQIEAQTRKMWVQHQTPLTDMITQAKQAVDDFVSAKGSDVKNPALREALAGAVKQPTLQEIMKMKPSDARKALETASKNRR